MTTAVRSPAAAWAATHRVLPAIVAVTIALAAATTVVLTVLPGNGGTTTPQPPGSDRDRSGCGGVTTVQMSFLPTC